MKFQKRFDRNCKIEFSESEIAIAQSEREREERKLRIQSSSLIRFRRETSSNRIKHDKFKEMEPIFSEELQLLYKTVLAQQHNLAFASLAAAFSSAGENPFLANQLKSTFLLSSSIPREEIESDPEQILLKNFRDNLKQLDTSLKGCRQPDGFLEGIEKVLARPAFPATPVPSKRSRSQTSPFAIDPMSQMTPPRSSDGEDNEDETNQVRSESDSGTSSQNKRMKIDGDESISETIVMLGEVRIKTEKPDDYETIHEVPADDDKKTEQEAQTLRDGVKLRFERLRIITKKKPKINIDLAELEYHNNMARYFPNAEMRTELEKKRREKNTLSARISRSKNKAYERILEVKSYYLFSYFHNYYFKQFSTETIIGRTHQEHRIETQRGLSSSVRRSSHENESNVIRFKFNVGRKFNRIRENSAITLSTFDVKSFKYFQDIIFLIVR